jgi:hypothetical protein
MSQRKYYFIYTNILIEVCLTTVPTVPAPHFSVISREYKQ